MRKDFSPLVYIIFSVLLTFLTVTTVAADTPVVHVSPKPSWILPCKSYNKRPSARNIENGAYTELIEEQVNVEEKATYNHFITQIVSDAGVQDNSDVSVSFNPSYERLDFHEIIVWRNNKPQSRLNTAAFKMLPDETELDKFIYDGTYSAKYILADIRKGDKIEYSYTITGFNPIFDNKFCRSIFFQASDLMVHQYTTLLFKADRKMNMKSFNLRSQPKISTVGGFKRYEWEDFDVPAVPSNKFGPKWYNQYARVQVSEFDNWADVINWGLKINPIKTSFTSELADTIARFKKLSGNDKEKYFRAAVTFVQDGIRYMGIETGEYSHKANSPDKVFMQRYGDCKDKSLLLASMLNADGIEAHMALINTGLEDKTEDFIPSPVLFDHAVVVCVINGKQVWVDATMANQGGKGIDLYFPPYLEGLILKDGNTGLSKIKETKAGNIVSEEKYDIKNEYSPVKFNVITTYTYGQADFTRDRIANNGIAQTEKDYLDYYSKTYSKIETADSLIIKDDRAKNELTTIESYTVKDFFKLDSAKGKFSADFYAKIISEQLPAIDGQVKTPISVNYPFDVDYTVNIVMTDGSGWDIANEHEAIDRSTYKFTSDKTVNDDRLSLHYKFAYFKDYVPLEKLAEFKEDITQLKDDKLSYGFYYTPNTDRIPFELNKLMFIITILVLCLFAYLGLRIYKTPTREELFYDRNYYSPPLGGWLILLIITLFATPFGFIKDLINDRYYSIGKWELVNVGLPGLLHKISLLYEVTGYAILICYSAFCLLLIFKKRDITVYYLKRYFVCIVLFLFIDYFFNAVIDGRFQDYNMERIIKVVVISALWTYYLNVSTRVRETFVVPYPN